MPNAFTHFRWFASTEAPFVARDVLFESIDNVEQTLAGAGVAGFWFGMLVLCAPGGGPLSTARLRKLDPIALDQLTFAKRRRFKTKLQLNIDNEEAIDCYIITGNKSVHDHYFGFRFKKDKVQGICNDAGTEQTIDLITGLGPGYMETYLLDAILYPTNGVYFYIDGVYLGRIITHLPTDLNAAQSLYEIQASGTPPTVHEIYISRFQYTQDI